MIALLKEIGTNVSCRTINITRLTSSLRTLPYTFGALLIALRLNPAARPDSFHLLCTAG